MYLWRCSFLFNFDPQTSLLELDSASQLTSFEQLRLSHSLLSAAERKKHTVAAHARTKAKAHLAAHVTKAKAHVAAHVSKAHSRAHHAAKWKVPFLVGKMFEVGKLGIANLWISEVCIDSSYIYVSIIVSLRALSLTVSVLPFVLARACVFDSHCLPSFRLVSSLTA